MSIITGMHNLITCLIFFKYRLRQTILIGILKNYTLRLKASQLIFKNPIYKHCMYPSYSLVVHIIPHPHAVGKTWVKWLITCERLVMPSTKQIPSRMLDLPLPFRPVTALNNGSKPLTSVRCAYDLKPSSTIALINMVICCSWKDINRVIYCILYNSKYLMHH